ncbi:unnamed protein product [Allacma fusca]|uniref:Uncharacterized protein n=1 Tax=Allacma fusca TaxID=39272 RepID=A0A8J2LA43_9HEXA|nr:unnamed protein product [Allacma fusca]
MERQKEIEKASSSFSPHPSLINGLSSVYFPVRNSDSGTTMTTRRKNETTPIKDDSLVEGKLFSRSATFPTISSGLTETKSHTQFKPCNFPPTTSDPVTTEKLNEMRRSCSNGFSLATCYGQQLESATASAPTPEAGLIANGKPEMEECKTDKVTCEASDAAMTSGGGNESASKTSFLAGYMGSWKRSRYLSGNFTVSGDTMEGIVQCLVFLKAFSVRNLIFSILLPT